MKTARRVLSLALLVLIAAACTAPQPVAPTTTQPPLTSIPLTVPSFPTRTAALVQTPTPTKTTTPTHWPTITPGPTRTPTPIPTVTWTPLPTLPPDKALARVLELLKTNGSCKLPCWWGIVPGKTSWAETKQILARLGIYSNYSTPSDGAIFHGANFDFRGPYINGQPTTVYNDIDFHEKNAIVEDIYLRSQGYNNPIDFQAAWERYSPRQVMVDYGSPSRVWMYTDALNYGERTGYDLWLAYDNLGFLIRYQGTVSRKSFLVYQVCPRFYNGKDIDDILIILQSPDNPRPLEERDPYYPHVVQYTHTLEEAAGLTVEVFYKLFTQGKQPACFDTPMNIWPSSFP
jgi:hypothetical protein